MYRDQNSYVIDATSSCLPQIDNYREVIFLDSFKKL